MEIKSGSYKRRVVYERLMKLLLVKEEIDREKHHTPVSNNNHVKTKIKKEKEKRK